MNDYMKELELELHNFGYTTVAGVDEAGRGPLAGPVVAAAVVLPDDSDLEDVNDSKKLSAKKREVVYEQILQAGKVGIGLASPAEIDQVNILQATYLAMHRAVNKLHEQCEVSFCLIDGNKTIPDLPIKQKAIIKGDATCYSIAAASIVAKVFRDRLMLEYDLVYPQYGFASHKGYPTRQHLAALVEYGPTPIHRFTFAHVERGKTS